MFIDRSDTARYGTIMDGMHVLSFVVGGNTCVRTHRPKTSRERRARSKTSARRIRATRTPSFVTRASFISIHRTSNIVNARRQKRKSLETFAPFPVSRDDFFLHSVLRLFEKKKYERKSIARDIARDRAKSTEKCPTGRCRSSMHVAEPSLPFLQAYARLRPLSASLSRVPSQALNHCFFARIFFSFLSFLFHFCLSRASNDAISSASFVQEAKENLKKNRDPRFARRGSVLFERSCLWRS